jgi:secreted trypsin-like serine protease
MRRKSICGWLSVIVCFQFMQGCGSADSSQGQLKIYNGTVDTEHDSVGLLIRDGKRWCTATLIAEKTALSAGHCFEGKSSKPAQLIISFKSGAIQSRVVEVVVHPKYSEWFGRVTNDVAVLKLDSAPRLPAMKLASKVPQAGEAVLFVGYGYKDATDKDSFDGTRRKGVSTIDKVEQQKIFFPKPQNNNMSQVCKGDSGGPIFAKQGEDTVQIGIVSGSTEGASKKTCNVTAYAARVDAYVSWIQDQI